MEDDMNSETNYSAKNYIIGFVLSLGSTLVAYLFVTRHVSLHHAWPSDNAMVFVLTTLALSQLIVQLVYFLHLGQESKPRWNLLVFSFMICVVFILVFGSLWIMYHLNYHTPSTHQINQYIRSQDGL
jgi:cytochrome o ubiquinol oxidase operon protein cyoD